jgi:CHAT domain-containing protein/tetratricopeptide (TPR) repeat protein
MARPIPSGPDGPLPVNPTLSLQAGRGRRTRSAALLVGVLFTLAGVDCAREAPFSADIAFRDARAKFQQADLAGAFAEADFGMRELEHVDPPGAWRFRVLKAEVFIWQGKSRDAIDLLTPQPPATTAADVATRRVLLLGQASNAIQRYDDAARFLGEAARMADARAPAVAGDVALSQGTARYARHDLDGADALFQRALQIASERQQPFLEANARGSLGLVRMQRHQYAEAADWFQSAVVVATSVQARGSIEKSFGNLGWAYQSMGELDRALELFTEAETQARHYGMIKDQQIWLANLGGLQVSRRDYEAAEGTFRKALEISRQLEGKLQIAQNLTSLAAIMLDRDRVDEADRFNAEAITLKRAIEERDSELFSLVTQAEILTRRNDRAQAEMLLDEVIRNAKANLRLRAEAQAKLAKLHAAQGDAPRANQEYRDAIVSIEQAREVLGREEFKLPFSTNAKPIYDAYVGFLMDRGDVAIACAVADLSRAQTLTQGLGVRPPFSIADFSAADRGCAKPSSGVVLAYWVAPKRSYLWVLTPAAVKGFTLPGEEILTDLVTRFRKALAGPLDAQHSRNAAGLELYARLIDPAKIASGGDVTIIPDGTLCSLNFETLLVPAPITHYWIEDVSIANASAIAMLGAARPARTATMAKLLLIGNPQSPDNRYPPLEHATAEMTAISGHFGSGDETVLSGPAATPAAYSRAMPGNYDLIHFVAHGTASRPSPLDSAIVLSADGTSHNLYARDIVLTPLVARLVTISACDSAGTRTYSGEGLVGLSWAFLRAGAREVIAALWEVNDASTAQLMDRLYAGIAAGATPAEALRAAKLAMLKSETIYRRPFYWAPFVIYSGNSGNPTIRSPRGPRAN